MKGGKDFEGIVSESIFSITSYRMDSSKFKLEGIFKNH